MQRETTAVDVMSPMAFGVIPDGARPHTLPTLSNEEIARYSRHLMLPEVGMEGQRKLKAASEPVASFKWRRTASN